MARYVIWLVMYPSYLNHLRYSVVRPVWMFGRLLCGAQSDGQMLLLAVDGSFWFQTNFSQTPKKGPLLEVLEKTGT